MVRERSSNDDVTERQLTLLIGLVVVLASVAVVWAVVEAASTPEYKRPPLVATLALIAAIAIGNRIAWTIRVRSHRRQLSWPEVGMLVGLTVAPPAWVILFTCVAIAVARMTAHLPLRKSILGVAKEVLVASAAGAVFVLSGTRAGDGTVPFITIAVATVVMWLVDEMIMVPVLALATRSGVRQSLRANWDMRVIGLIARYAVSVLIIALLASGGDARLLLLVAAPLVLCVHLWQTGQIRRREERQSWQHLAQTTDELNVIELDAVLGTAVTGAAQLFSVDEVEIELHQGTASRLIRGAAEVGYDGPPAEAPERAGAVISTPLAGHDGDHPIGELRLRLRSSVALPEAETYKLKTFASALYTAIRNATAYAELARISAEHAYAAAPDPLTGRSNTPPPRSPPRTPGWWRCC